MIRRALLAAVLAASALAGGDAQAHDRSVSYSSWRLDGGRADVVLRLTRLELTHLAWWSDRGAEARFGTYAQDRLRLFAGATPCEPTGAAQPVPSADDWLAVGWSVVCPPDGGLHLESTLLLDVAPSHLHLARVALANAAPVEFALTGAVPSPAIAGGRHGPPLGTSLGGWVGLGVGHIVTGYDHLAFLFALLLLGETFGAVAQIVTGFTVGHSLTLALAALGWARVDAPAVEALIGLSIALVAIENVWVLGGHRGGLPAAVVVGLTALAATAAGGHGVVPAVTLAGFALFAGSHFGLLRRAQRPERLRWFVALLFGLVHGFAFAGVLLDAELPPDRLLPALFGFNAGVELGQVGLIACVWPLWRYSARSPSTRRLVVEAGSAVAAGLGLFWFVSRTFG